MKKSFYGLTLSALLNLVATPALAEEHSQPTPTPSASSAPDRAGESPETVPAGYRRVPSGFAHESCIHEIPDGASVDEAGVVTHRDGHKTHLPKCNYGFLRSHRAAADVSQVPTVNGWVEASWWNATSSPSALGAYFSVPNPPSENHGQLIYLFPSLEPADGSKIVQPVLQWGVSPAGGGYYWALASWAVGNGWALHSPLIAVSPGHQIRGNPYGQSCSGSVCPNWVIYSQDVTTGATTQFTYTGNTVPLTAVQGGVLEGYNVQTCGDYPSSPTYFTSIHVRDFANRLMSPQFFAYYWVSGCGYSVQAGSDWTYLYY
jgi:hypothetical protein